MGSAAHYLTQGYALPFQSRDQQSYLYATKPEVAKKFAEHSSKKKSLPKKVKKVKNSTKKK